jgi:hypothetical protein
LTWDNPAYQPDERRLAKPRKYKESSHIFIALKKEKILAFKQIYPSIDIYNFHVVSSFRELKQSISEKNI